jgi:hypothetical protein
MVLGKEHPYTLIKIGNLAEVLSPQGKYEQAEEMHRQSLRLYEMVLGKGFPYTMWSCHHLNQCLSPTIMFSFLSSAFSLARVRGLFVSYNNAPVAFPGSCRACSVDLVTAKGLTQPQFSLSAVGRHLELDRWTSSPDIGIASLSQTLSELGAGRPCHVGE